MGLVLVCGLGTWALVRQAGDRVPVLMAAEDIGRYEPIERSDLQVVLVAAEPSAQLVAEADIDEVLGQLSTSDLPRGSLLSAGQLVAPGEGLVADDEALVGARLDAGAAPIGDLPRGTSVVVVVRPDSPDGEVREIPGRLAELGEANQNSGTRQASLIVPQDQVGLVAAAAAEGRVAVAALEGGLP